MNDLGVSEIERLPTCPCGAEARLVNGYVSAGKRVRFSVHCSKQCGHEVIGDYTEEVVAKWQRLNDKGSPK